MAPAITIANASTESGTMDVGAYNRAASAGQHALPQSLEAVGKQDARVVVSLRSIEKSYGSLRVVGPLNLDIYDSEFLTLLGPSGSGKTTTLMMIAGLQNASQGLIEIDGRDLTNVPPYRRNLGVMFQDYALFPHMTVEQNIAFPLVQRRLARGLIAKRVSEIAEMVQLGSLLTRRIQELSGGQRQRVALARTLVFQPRIVLMDEPLGALDRRLREQMQVEIKRIHDRLGTTFVVVTHDQAEALTMSDRVAVFNHGVIEQIGTPQALYSRPQTAFVANFLGDNNNLRGKCLGATPEGYCRIELPGGNVIAAVDVDRCGVGSSVVATVRPECADLQIASPSDAHRLPGRLTEMIFHGDHWRAAVSLREAESFSVKITDSRLASALAIGAEVSVGWPDNSCSAFRVHDHEGPR